MSASTGQYSRQGGSNRDNDFSCNYAVKDADFELPEGSSHYDSARITLEFNTDPGCLGPVGGITPPKTVTLTTGSKIRDGINDKQGTFGQTRFEATFSADDLSVASEANCTLEKSDKAHEMTCNSTVPVAEFGVDDGDAEDKFSIASTVRFTE